MDRKGKMTSDTRVDVNEEMSNNSLVRLSRHTEGPKNDKQKEGVVRTLSFLQCVHAPGLGLV
jgi:hypothetical protein